MMNQTNDTKGMKNTNETGGGVSRMLEFCRDNKMVIGIGILAIILLIVIIKFTGGGGKGSDGETVPEANTEALTPESPRAPVGAFEQDAYPQINELINNYYTAYAQGKNKKLAKLAEPISDAEKSYISAFSDYVGKYKNITCHTKKGLDESSYIVSVCMEIKFKGIKTTAPGMETFYVRTRDDGSLYIDNLYGQFNSKINGKLYGQVESGTNEFEVDANVTSFIEAFNQQEDVIALQTQVQQAYEAALAADAELKTMVESTIPDAMTVWASDQVAAVKKAEEEKAAAEEAAKKAAEDEAAKQAEAEKNAAELASAVAVYAIDNVNVRADASETAEIIGKLSTGTKTTRLEEKDGWSRINYSEGTQGYVKSEFLSTEAPTEQPSENQDAPAASSAGFAEGTVITIKESVNVRKSMGEDAEKIATAFAGETVTVIMSYAEGWTKVTYGDKTGFIKTELLQ